MITVVDIVKKWLVDNGYDGLWHDDGPCGCGVNDWRNGTPPCGDGPYSGCCAAHAGESGLDADGQHRDVLYYPDKRTMDEREMDRNRQCREIRREELMDVR